MKEKMNEMFDTTPQPRFLRGLQNKDWNAVGAIAELVDNSLGAGRGNAQRVEIEYDSKQKRLRVLDNGVGMDAVGSLFQLGATAGRTPGDIGEYGQGGTLALLWLFKDVTVWTMRDGLVSKVGLVWRHVFAMEKFPVVSNEWRKPSPNTPQALLNLGHGTLIVGTLLPARKFHAAVVARDLAATFAPATRHGKDLIWICNGIRSSLSAPMPAFTKSVDVDVIISGPDAEFLAARGKIGVVPDLPLQRSVVHLGFGPRVISHTRDFFDSPDGGEKFRVAGIAGWIDLQDGWQPYLTTTKDALNDAPLWDDLCAAVFAKIKPLLAQLRTEKVNLLLDGIALELNTALESAGKIPVPGASPEVNIDYPASGAHPWKERHDHQREPGEDGETRITAPRVSRLEMVTQTDSSMEGTLCQVNQSHGDLNVFINGDNLSVKSALEKEPHNRLALAYLVMSEVASFLVRPENQCMLQRIFHRQYRRINAAREALRRGLVMRMLIDCTHDVAA